VIVNIFLINIRDNQQDGFILRRSVDRFWRTGVKIYFSMYMDYI